MVDEVSIRANRHFSYVTRPGVVVFLVQVLKAIGNFCIIVIAIGLVIEIIVMFPIQRRKYRSGINNLLVLLIGGIPIAMPTVLSVTMAIGSHRLSKQVSHRTPQPCLANIASLFDYWDLLHHFIISSNISSYFHHCLRKCSQKSDAVCCHYE